MQDVDRVERWPSNAELLSVLLRVIESVLGVKQQPHPRPVSVPIVQRQHNIRTLRYDRVLSAKQRVVRNVKTTTVLELQPYIVLPTLSDSDLKPILLHGEQVFRGNRTSGFFGRIRTS